MGQIVVRVPFITLRTDADGNHRPRYIPGPHHRGLGFKGEDLKHPDGSWYSLDQCQAWAQERADLVATMEAAKKAGKRAKRPKAAGITVGELFERWFKQPRLNGVDVVEGKKQRRALAPSTVAFYRSQANRLEDLDDGLLWASPARAVTAGMVTNDEKGILHKIEVAHGLHTARGVRAAASACWEWAKPKGLVNANPWKGGGYSLPTAAPRIRYGSVDEIGHLVKAADAIGLPEIGDAILLGVWTGQRQADRLSLTDAQFMPAGPKAVGASQSVGESSIVFRQRKKHGQIIVIPEAPDLARRLNAARIRRADWRVNYAHVILDEEHRAPFADRWAYGKKFRKVRDAAVRGIPGKLEAMPSLADFHDQDLRDTAVTWLALAGVTLPGIASITGHSLDTIGTILKHYLGMHPELARTAIAQLVAWFDQQGEGVQ